MNKFIIPAIAALSLAVPAAAQTSVVIIGDRGAPAKIETTSMTLSERIEIAAEKACKAPFIRDLKGQVIYQECLEEVRTEIRTKLAEREGTGPIVLAAR